MLLKTDYKTPRRSQIRAGLQDGDGWDNREPHVSIWIYCFLIPVQILHLVIPVLCRGLLLIEALHWGCLN